MKKFVNYVKIFQTRKWLIISLAYILLAINFNLILQNFPNLLGDTARLNHETLPMRISLSILAAVFGDYQPLLYLLLVFILVISCIVFALSYVKSIIYTIEKSDDSVLTLIITMVIPLIGIIYFYPKVTYIVLLSYIILLLIKLIIFKNFKYYTLLVAFISIGIFLYILYKHAIHPITAF